MDTSSIAGLHRSLTGWAVSEVGFGRVAHGTDLPLYFVPTQRVRIEQAEISNQDKRMILWGTAVVLRAPSERGGPDRWPD